MINSVAAILYSILFRPKSLSDDSRRREFIFTVLLFGTTLLVLVAFSVVLIHSVVQGARYDGAPPMVLLVPTIILASLYAACRRHFRNYQIYIFLGIFILLASYSLFAFGYVLPEGLLTYAMVIIMAGILLSARAAFGITGLIILCLTALMLAETRGITHPDTSDLYTPIGEAEVIIYGTMFIVMVVVTWLSNRNINLSLARARRSEAALLDERNSLEDKVRERTQQLEYAQAEKVFQLHRFAEIGRVSSTLLHELTNPLTSVLLELEQLDGAKQSAQLAQIKKGVSAMEQYVAAARRQLRNESELTVFDCADTIERLIVYLRPYAQRQHVQLQTQLIEDCKLRGDVIRFGQAMANLISNAVDAYDSQKKKQKIVSISMSRAGGQVEITVHDRGHGITPAQLKQIFEPFYTTKPIEKGTGIGLSITKRAIEEVFGGTIVVTSNKRIGTKFIVSLPLHET